MISCPYVAFCLIVYLDPRPSIGFRRLVSVRSSSLFLPSRTHAAGLPLRLLPFAQVRSRKGPSLLPGAISAYVRRLEQIHHELASKHGPSSHLSRVKEVILTSDESDPQWWEQIAAMGWKTVDHQREQTVKKFGHW